MHRPRRTEGKCIFFDLTTYDQWSLEIAGLQNVLGWNKHGVAVFKMRNLELSSFSFRYRLLKNAFYFRQDLNLRPSACEADVITTTLRKQARLCERLNICGMLRSMKLKRITVLSSDPNFTTALF